MRKNRQDLDDETAIHCTFVEWMRILFEFWRYIQLIQRFGFAGEIALPVASCSRTAVGSIPACLVAMAELERPIQSNG